MMRSSDHLSLEQMLRLLDCREGYVTRCVLLREAVWCDERNRSLIDSSASDCHIGLLTGSSELQSNVQVMSVATRLF